MCDVTVLELHRLHFRQKSRARPVSGRTRPRADREAKSKWRGARGGGHGAGVDTCPRRRMTARGATR